MLCEAATLYTSRLLRNRFSYWIYGRPWYSVDQTLPRQGQFFPAFLSTMGLLGSLDYLILSGPSPSPRTHSGGGSESTSGGGMFSDAASVLSAAFSYLLATRYGVDAPILLRSFAGLAPECLRAPIGCRKLPLAAKYFRATAGYLLTYLSRFSSAQVITKTQDSFHF